MATTGTAVDVVMPQMGVSVSEGTITKWSKQVGEQIEADETLLEISTDKVDTEVPSPAAGVVTEILVQEGETVEVGTVLARIGGEAGAAAPAPVRRSAAPEPAAAPAAPAEPSAPVAAEPGPPTERETEGNGRSFVSPVVARIASEHDIDPTQVPGTGTGGRVTKKDIQAFIEAGPPAGRGARGTGRVPGAGACFGSTRRCRRKPRRPQLPVIPRRGSRSSRCPPCAAGSPSTCAARSTPPRT